MSKTTPQIGSILLENFTAPSGTAVVDLAVRTKSAVKIRAVVVVIRAVRGVLFQTVNVPTNQQMAAARPHNATSRFST